MTHVYNPSLEEMETGESLELLGQPTKLVGELQASERPGLIEMHGVLKDST